MTLYDLDFYTWTQDQAGRLRRLAEARPNVGAGIDWEHVAEEIEDMGRARAHALRSALKRIIEHLLKLEFSPAHDPRNGWRRTVRTQRDDAADLLAENPSLKRRDTLDAMLEQAWQSARSLAVDSMMDEGEQESATAIPASCPYTLDQVLERMWWPANRHQIDGGGAPN